MYIAEDAAIYFIFPYVVGLDQSIFLLKPAFWCRGYYFPGMEDWGKGVPERPMGRPLRWLGLSLGNSSGDLVTPGFWGAAWGIP